MSEIDHESAKNRAQEYIDFDKRVPMKNEDINLARAYIDLEAKVEKYQSRLEITHDYDGYTGERREIPQDKRDTYPDGITCRDATIHMLKSELAAERKRVEALIDVIHEANGKAYPFAEMQEAMNTIMEVATMPNPTPAQLAQFAEMIGITPETHRHLADFEITLGGIVRGLPTLRLSLLPPLDTPAGDDVYLAPFMRWLVSVDRGHGVGPSFCKEPERAWAANFYHGCFPEYGASATEALLCACQSAGVPEILAIFPLKGDQQ